MNTAHPASSSVPYRAQHPPPPDDLAYQQLPMAPYFPEGYAPQPGGRGPIVDQMQPPEGLAPLAPMTTAVQQPVVDFAPLSVIENGRRYELSVVQQPRRARMCGFGDKDRRPITPPPCVRLIVTDVATGNEIDCNDIDHSMFVLNVDLWAQDATREVNLVRHSASSPSISSTVPASFTEVAQSAAAYNANSLGLMRQHELSNPPFKFEMGVNQGPSYPASSPYSPYRNQIPMNSYGQPPPPQHYGEGVYQMNYPQNPEFSPGGYQGGPPSVPMYYMGGGEMAPQGYPQPQHGMEYGLSSPMNHYDSPFPPNDPGIQRVPISQTQPSGMYTRNLIGSLSVSAFRLTDPNDRIGIWFVLQDLSVRTEGHFRLRFSFVNVGAPGCPETPVADPSNPVQSSVINTGKAPVLAGCFSEVFTVYSAKKFPGVVESTDLSKCFATQGIKIPIRKDGPSGKKDRDDEYDED